MDTGRAGRRPARDIDRHVGARMRDRRIMLGLARQQLAGLIGVTGQQVHKYETGINRIAAGRLHQVAQSLGVEVGYLFEGADGGERCDPRPEQRRMHRLARDFVKMPSHKHREALCTLARALGGAEEEATAPREAPRAAGLDAA